MSKFIVNERITEWDNEGHKQVTMRSHEISMEDVSSILSLWGGVILHIKDRVLCVYPNGHADMGYYRTHHGQRVFECDGVGRVDEPLQVIALAHKLWPNARYARESTFYHEPKDPKPLGCKYRE